MSKKRKQWPPIYRRENASGNPSFQVALGLVDGKRIRLSFPTLQEAQTFAEQARTQRKNEGVRSLSLPRNVSLDAAKAEAILSPHGVTILEAAKYYKLHVLAYKEAPLVKDVVAKYLDLGVQVNNSKRTLSDKRSRFNPFIDDFGDVRLSDISLDQLKDWVADEEWSPVTRVNYLTKVSQLYGFAKRNRWVDENITKFIERPKIDETQPEIFTPDEAYKLLSNAHEFGLLPYIALGLFAGIRSSELMRLKSDAIKFENKSIIIGANVAKKRARRVIEMQPALLAWLEPCRHLLMGSVSIVDAGKFRFAKEQLLASTELPEWKYNGLRHSFGSYHLARFHSVDLTADQMGNSVAMVHKHYKSLVTPDEVEKFWELRPPTDPSEVVINLQSVLNHSEKSSATA